jgi:chromosome segregation ATPase
MEDNSVRRFGHNKLQAKIHQLQIALEDTERSRKEQVEHIIQLETQIKSLEKALEDANTQNQQLHTRVSQSVDVSNFEQLKEMFEQKSLEYNKMVIGKEALNKQNADCNAQIILLKTEVDILTQEQTEMKVKYKVLDEKCKLYYDQITENKKYVRDLERDFIVKDTNISNLENQITTLKQQLIDKTSDIIQQLQFELDYKQNQIMELYGKLQQSENEKMSASSFQTIVDQNVIRKQTQRTKRR